ncbi:MAG: FtsX-like permease family protein [Pseudomonadales bacterium]|nr:FtsX-like permease family protein [Pseudomonadales bacterium]
MLALHLANRLLFHSSNAFARFVTWVSFIGLMLGVTILTVVVSVMNGFDHELRTRLLSTIPHVTIDADNLNAQLAEQVPKGGSVSRYFQGLGALNLRGRVYPMTLYGIDPDAENQQSLIDGLSPEVILRLKRNPNGIVMGAPLVRMLRVEQGDAVRLMTVDVSTTAVQPRILNFALEGEFSFGAETDYSLVVINLNKFASEQWRAMGDLGLQIQLPDPMLAGQLVERLQASSDGIAIASWETRYGELFQAVQLEKSMMFVLLLLVVAIAAFNIIAGQSMLVEDKRQNIAILRTMGAKPRLIRQLFFFQGAIVSLSGTTLGLVLGLCSSIFINDIMAGIEFVSGMHLLDGSFFVEIPVRVQLVDLLVISALTLSICLAAALLPAQRAARLDPVAGLH